MRSLKKVRGISGESITAKGGRSLTLATPTSQMNQSELSHDEVSRYSSLHEDDCLLECCAV
jgi:hypothetical protein